MTVLLDGCIPGPGGVVVFDPHTTPRLNPFDGTVLDERTHAPIAGAKIFLIAHPKVSCKSDSSGHFKFQEVVNWHWGLAGNPGGSEDLPHGEQWGWDITVSHTNYIPRQISFSYYSDHVVLLKKLDEPSEPHPCLIFNGSGEILNDMGAAQYLKPGDIRIVGHDNGKLDTWPNTIHIGFVQRVYDPQITPVNSPDRARIVFPVRKDLDWEFRIVYDWDKNSRSFESNVKDSFRMYRLEFIP